MDTLEEFFEFEFCENCSGDAEHHTLCRDPLGKLFIRCDYPPTESGASHSVIRRYLSDLGYEKGVFQ